jgi:aryl-alcohol dehydrogenase-like predicted oxidoreductase
MKMRGMGPSGATAVSVVGFGSWEAGGDAWGPNESEERVIEAIRAGLDAGMNWIDTAEVYGKGVSERIVGRAVQGRQDQALVFTKVAPVSEGTGFRPEQVREAIRASLDRLGLDHVDLYQLHWPDETGIPVEETWGTMVALRDEGLARHVGVSNFDRALIERCESVGRVDSVQNEFSLLVPEDRPELLPWLAERGIAYLAYSPMAAGILTGAMRADHVFADDDWRSGRRDPDEEHPELFRPGAFEANVAKAERLGEVATRLGATAAALALAWVVAVSPNTVAIAGSRSPEHARSNATAGELELDQDVLAEVDAIFFSRRGTSSSI